MQDQITTDLRFSIVPAWLLDSQVSDKAVRLYAVLAGYANAETGQAYPGRKLLSNRLDCSTKTVDRAVIELISLGAIKKQQRVKDGHYQSSLYTVVRSDPASRKSRPSVTDDSTSRHTRPDPASPVSHRTRTTELEPLEQEPLKGKPARKTRLPDDWYPSDRLLMMFDSKWPTLDRDFEIEQFITYWHGAGGVKLDWDLTFQGWMNRNEKQARERSAWRDEKSKTNSERNVEKLRASMALLENKKEVENGQA